MRRGLNLTKKANSPGIFRAKISGSQAQQEAAGRKAPFCPAWLTCVHPFPCPGSPERNSNHGSDPPHRHCASRAPSRPDYRQCVRPEKAEEEEDFLHLPTENQHVWPAKPRVLRQSASRLGADGLDGCQSWEGPQRLSPIVQPLYSRETEAKGSHRWKWHEVTVWKANLLTQESGNVATSSWFAFPG